MKRLDVYLFESGLLPSREKAKRAIIDKRVKINGTAADKPSTLVDGSEEIKLIENDAYVGRGAYKLIKALDGFGIDVNGKVCADIGASTGGFTQVLLERGAALVYAVDVGHGQLAKELLTDSRVINCEGVNARALPSDFFDTKPQLISCDVSFISITKLLPSVADAAAEDAELVVLIKPQFEAGKKALNKNGLVTDKKAHIQTLSQLVQFFELIDLTLCGLDFSPISGGDGNIEYLAYLKKEGIESKVFDIEYIVKSAFENAKKR